MTKFKIGDKVKVIKSNKNPQMVGCVGTIGDIGDIGWNDDQMYHVDGLPVGNDYTIRESFLDFADEIKNDNQVKPKRIFNLANGKPNFCVGCNKFNEYQSRAYVCFECENYI